MLRLLQQRGLWGFPDFDVEQALSCHSMVDFNGVVDFQHAPLVADGGVYLFGGYSHLHSPIGGIVQGEVLSPLFKDHLGIDLALPGQSDPPGLNKKAGTGTLQTGEFALLIAEDIIPCGPGGSAARR